MRQAHTPIDRILIVASSRYEWYAPAWQRGLTELGTEARLLSYDNMWSPGIIGRIERRFMVGPALARINRLVLREADAWKPDVVLLYASYPVWPATVKALTALAWVATYHNDNPFGGHGDKAYFRYFRKSLPFAHSHHVYREVNIDDYKQREIERVTVLRSYYLPWLDRVPQLTAADRERWGHEIVFAGHAEPDARIDFVRAIVDAGLPLKLYGYSNRRRGWQALLPAGVYEHLKPIEVVHGADYRKVLAASKICLCFLSQAQRDQYTRRVFEIPAVGGFLLCERTPVMQRLYDEDREAIYFSSTDELVEKCRYYLKHDQERARTAAAGHRRCLSSNYDVASRMRQWLDDTTRWMQDGP